MHLPISASVLVSGGECVISSCLFIEACGDAVEVLLAQLVEQLRSRCSPRVCVRNQMKATTSYTKLNVGGF